MEVEIKSKNGNTAVFSFGDVINFLDKRKIATIDTTATMVVITVNPMERTPVK